MRSECLRSKSKESQMAAKKVVKKGKNVLIISASKQAFELGKKI